VQLEGRVVAMHPFGAPHAEAYGVEVAVQQAHVEQGLLIPGRADHIDPIAWQPLIMKFAEFFGVGLNLHPSRLARGFGINHAGNRRGGCR
jgi:hypothetical protein